MKIFIGAVALLVATPAAAQAVDPHAGHSKQQHEQHQQKSGHQQQDGHAGHKMDCCKDGKCCDKAKQKGEKMACCAEHGEGKAGDHKGHGQH